MTARSMKFSSSRTLPGQRYSVKLVIDLVGNRIDRLFHASRVFLREVTHEERNFRALFITRIEIRESVTYDGKQ
jgi:hypothetical protein